MEVYQNGELNIVPPRFGKTYMHWLENIRDWCISRQIWWGHRIPAYYCADCGHITVSKHDPGKCEKCGSANIKQDEDTLDTWFSSGLWPFSTLGWRQRHRPSGGYQKLWCGPAASYAHYGQRTRQ